MASRLDRAAKAVADLEVKLTAQRAAVTAAEQQAAELVAQWQQLCLAHDFDGADNAKAIAANEARQAEAERQAGRARVVAEELARRLEGARRELAEAEHGARLEELATLERQEPELWAQLWKAAAVVADMAAQIAASTERRTFVHQAANASAKATGLARPVATAPSLTEQQCQMGAMGAARLLQRILAERGTARAA